MNLIVLKQNRQTYTPPDTEILQYGQYLGLTFPSDNKYKPLLLQALTAPLPPQWQACQTDDQERRLLFRNKHTLEVQEQHPLDALYREKIRRLKVLEGGLGVQAILEERESMLKESSQVYGGVGGSGEVEYTLREGNQGIINEISEEKSVYDQQQYEQPIHQPRLQPPKPPNHPQPPLSTITPPPKKSPRTYKKRRSTHPYAPTLLQSLQSRLLTYSPTPSITLSQILQRSYPQLENSQESAKLKEVIAVNEELFRRRGELRRVVTERKGRLGYLEELRGVLRGLQG